MASHRNDHTAGANGPRSLTGTPGRRRWAGIILVNAAGHLLLNLRDERPDLAYAGYWNLIGGVVEEDESAAAGMARELLEETGQSLPFEPLRVYEIASRRGDTVDYYIYHARLDKPASALHLGEGQEHRFFRPPELASLRIIPYELDILRDFVASPLYQGHR
jgi:8-oxo-dGTP diphosphatase